MVTKGLCWSLRRSPVKSPNQILICEGLNALTMDINNLRSVVLDDISAKFYSWKYSEPNKRWAKQRLHQRFR